MAEYGLPALAGGRLRSTFSKPHRCRTPAYLLLGYRNNMPESCFYFDKIKARDAEGVASNCILDDKEKMYHEVSGNEINFGGSWYFALGWAVSLVALPNQPSLPKPTGIRHCHYRLLSNQFHMVASCFHRAPLYASCGEAQRCFAVIHSPTTRPQRVVPGVHWCI